MKDATDNLKMFRACRPYNSKVLQECPTLLHKIDFKAMITSVPDAMAAMKADIDKALAAAEVLSTKTGQLRFVMSATEERRHATEPPSGFGAKDCIFNPINLAPWYDVAKSSMSAGDLAKCNWCLAVHGYRTAVQAEVTINQVGSFSMWASYMMRDVYDWAKQGEISIALQTMEKYGHGRTCANYGEVIVQVNWKAGQRLDSGATYAVQDTLF